MQIEQRVLVCFESYALILNLLISFGISDNWDFEKHIHKLTDCFIEAYDDSINIDFWINRFKKLFKKK